MHFGKNCGFILWLKYALWAFRQFSPPRPDPPKHKTGASVSKRAFWEIIGLPGDVSRATKLAKIRVLRVVFVCVFGPSLRHRNIIFWNQYFVFVFSRLKQTNTYWIWVTFGFLALTILWCWEPTNMCTLCTFWPVGFYLAVALLIGTSLCFWSFGMAHLWERASRRQLFVFIGSIWLDMNYFLGFNATDSPQNIEKVLFLMIWDSHWVCPWPFW